MQHRNIENQNQIRPNEKRTVCLYTLRSIWTYPLLSKKFLARTQMISISVGRPTGYRQNNSINKM